MEVSCSEEDFSYLEASRSEEASTSASSDEAASAYSTPAHKNGIPAPAAYHPYRWCVEGQYQIYVDAKMLNDKGVMTRTLTLEQKVLTGSLPTISVIYELSTRHRLEWRIDM